MQNLGSAAAVAAQRPFLRRGTAAVGRSTNSTPTANSASALPAAAADPSYNMQSYLPTEPIVPGSHVALALGQISDAQALLNQATFGSGNIAAGVASIVPQLFLAEAAWSLSAWQNNMPAASQAVANTVGGKFLSPVQVDHLIDGYFGWLGSFVMFVPEMAMRAASDLPDRPARDWYKFATQGIVQETTSGSSYYVSALYKQAEEIEKAYATWRQLQKEGKLAEAQEFFTDYKDQIVKYKSVAKVKDGEAKFNEMIRMIERSTRLDPDEKKARIIQIRRQQDLLARSLTAAR
jgi:hypothetical protein